MAHLHESRDDQSSQIIVDCSCKGTARRAAWLHNWVGETGLHPAKDSEKALHQIRQTPWVAPDILQLPRVELPLAHKEALHPSSKSTVAKFT